MKRLIEKIVFSGLTTAWLRATRPTRRSPFLLMATTEGTRRSPSADGMTIGSPPSMTATTELVVPRSIPMIFPMCIILRIISVSDRLCGHFRRRCMLSVNLFCHPDSSRSQHSLAQHITILYHFDDLTALHTGRSLPARWPRAGWGRSTGFPPASARHPSASRIE